MSLEKFARYYKDTKKSLTTGTRTFDHYARVFEYYSINDLEGKTILDIGAGNGNFANGANRLGANVISVDPRYRMPFGKKISKFGQEGMVAGLAQFLPLKDESCDEVIVSHVLTWINIGVTDALAEMLRVTKSNGVIKIHPAGMLINPLNLEPGLRIKQTHEIFTTLFITKSHSMSPVEMKELAGNIYNNKLVLSKEMLKQAKKV